MSRAHMLSLALLCFALTPVVAQTPAQYATGVDWECSLAEAPETVLLGAASMASSGGNIYILQGNTLRKLTPDLQEVAAVQLPDLPEALANLQNSRLNLACGLGSELVPTSTSGITPMQCSQQDVVQGLHEAHTMRTMATAQVTADAFGVYVLRGGRLTVYDTSLRELRNTPITQTLTADAKSCPICVSVMSNAVLMDQCLYRGLRQGIALPVQTTVGFVQPVTGLSRSSGTMQGTYGGVTTGPTGTWSSGVSSTETPYMSEQRMLPAGTGTLHAGTATTSGGVTTGPGTRTTPSTTGTARTGPYTPMDTSGAVGTSSWGVTPGGTFGGTASGGVRGTYESAPSTSGGGVITPGSYGTVDSDFMSGNGPYFTDEAPLITFASDRASARSGLNQTAGTTGGVRRGVSSGARPSTAGTFDTGSFAGPGTATSAGRPSAWGTRFGTGAGVGTPTGFGTSTGAGTTRNVTLSRGAGTTTQAAFQQMGALLSDSVRQNALAGTVATVTTTPGFAETTSGRINVPSGAVVSPSGLVVTPAGVVIGPTGIMGSNQATSRTTSLSPTLGVVPVPDSRNLVTTLPGTLSGPDGTIPLSVGTVITANGTVITPNGTVIGPEGGISNPGVSNFTSNAATTTTFGTGIYAPVAAPYWTTGMGFTEAGLGSLAQPTLTRPIDEEPYLEGNVTYIPQQVQAPVPAPVPTGYTAQVLTPLSMQQPVYVQQPVYAQPPVYVQQPTYYQQPTYWQQPTAFQQPTAQQQPTGMGWTQPAVAPQQWNGFQPLNGQQTTVSQQNGTGSQQQAEPVTSSVERVETQAQVPPQAPAMRTVSLNECASRFAWMYNVSLQEGVMMPIAVRNIIDGCVQLGYAGDESGPQRLHVIVLRPDGGPDTSAKISAFAYPKTNVDAGRKLEFEGNGPGKFFAGFNPGECDGDTVAVRVKRPGMREQVVYFSLTQPEIAPTSMIPGGSTVYQTSVGSSAAQPCYGGVCVNCQGQLTTPASQTMEAPFNGQTPTSQTTPAPFNGQTGVGGPRVTPSGMSRETPASFQTTSDTCPTCTQKLSPQGSSTVQTGTSLSTQGSDFR
ncbi:MAG: hypothetical protein ACYC63_06165 [Armatimonadota bacterium]